MRYFAIAAAVLFLAGCESDGKCTSCKSDRRDAAADAVPSVDSATSGDGATSDASSGTTLGQLTQAEKATLCDSYIAIQGGYGQTKACPGGEEITEANQQECVAGMALVASFCPALTDRDVRACAESTGTDLCKQATSAECLKILNCAD